MKKLFVLFFVTGLILSSCHSADKDNRQNDTSATKGHSGPADSAKTSTTGDSTSITNSSDTTSLHGDTDSAVHPVH
ncbi:hypothetical protein [Mucilaginibacter sp. SJ]|uniref:hypothetical protein n=1 Tax=Mucilaginibacter sp. SJ TaxID=3029053 RepID=UPI0023A96B63|nr:hypothetical protein [Mucilaginibacter sp. SJ]WDZ98881.1 hypothetical protein MusilaSJ_15520 [Mucilaginibacter sp. SJ]